MALFYASGSRHQDTGKFHRQRRPGLQPGTKHQHGKYRLELISMETSAPFPRTKFHVAIFNPLEMRVAFLRDFTNAQQALAAAREWVEEREATSDQKA
jgi:hypothetical protein